MPFFKSLFRGNIITNLAIGAGLAILTPFVVPLIARIVKPAAKGAVKGGVLVSEMVASRLKTSGESTGSGTDGGKGVQAETAASKQGIARPLAVKVVKGGLAVYEKGREVLSGAEESVRGIAAEAKAAMAAPAAGNRVREAGEGASSPKSPKKAKKTAPKASASKTAAGRKTRASGPKKPV